VFAAQGFCFIENMKIKHFRFFFYQINIAQIALLLACHLGVLLSTGASADGIDELENVSFEEPIETFSIGKVSFKACRLSDPSASTYRRAQCAVVELPEDYQQSDGKKVSIFIARIKTTAKKPKKDPVLLIAGGPGQAASESFIFPGLGFHKIGELRDIYLIDQRGTGKSNKLNCDLPEDAELLDEAQQVVMVKACRDTLLKHSDLKQYTTSVAVRDFEEIRQLLNIPSWSVYGVSYGTRVAQHYLRRFPNGVKTLILDGVIAPNHALGTEIALQSQKALDALVSRCGEDPVCAESFPKLENGVKTLVDKLSASPVKVSLADLRTGEKKTVEFSYINLAMVLRLSLYSPETMSLLPVVLQAAYKYDNYAPLAKIVNKPSFNLSGLISHGMHNAVVCSEDIALLDEATIQRSNKASENTYLGSEMLSYLVKLCEHWPKGVVDNDMHQLLQTDTPVLLMSGSVDPITPPEYAEVAAQKLSNSLHLVLEGFSHSVARVGCMPTLMAKFIDEASVELDTSCLKKQKPAPIFLDFYGPAP